jgi:hypothetical protein
VTLCPLSCLLMLQIWSPAFSSSLPCALGTCTREIKNNFPHRSQVEFEVPLKELKLHTGCFVKIITKAKQSRTLLVAPSLHLLDKIMEIVHRVQTKKLPRTHIT